ncbi:MFS-type transporter cdmB [Physcia stellaris]|nr:MFS-type transporter cdmB [Physcia stellaris]
MEHAAGNVPATPDAATSNTSTGHAVSHPEDEYLPSPPPRVTDFTGDDKVIGPNAPVALLQPGNSTHSAASDEPSTATQSTDIKEKAEAREHSEREEEVDASGKTIENAGPAAEKDGEDVRDTVDEQNDDSKYPGGGALAILTFGLCMATFVVALDNTIIATAIPRITTVFDSLNDVGWYGSSYLLTTTSLQPSFGKIYTYFNIKWTYITALLIFELGSIVCAAAKNSVMLIVGRAIAGAGAAALFSGGMTIVGYSVALRKRALYISLLSSMFGISSVVGPILGGVLTDQASWRWCFWINLPFGGVALLTVFFFFKNPERAHTGMTLKQKLNQIDIGGAFLLICGIVCLLLALQWGGTTYPWHDSKVWGCILGLCDLHHLLVHGAVRTHLLSPFYFQAVKGTTAEGSGIRTIPYLVSTTIASIVVGGSVTVFGWYTPFMWFGAALFTVGAGLLYTLQVSSYAGKWIGYQLLTGIGAGASVQIPFIAVQVVLSAKDMPSGNALAIFFNSLGGALSISIAQNIFSNTLTQQIPKHTSGVDPATIIGAGATGVRIITPPDQLAGVLLAYNEAVTRALIVPIAVGGLSFICSLFMEMKSVKGKKLMAAAGA